MILAGVPALHIAFFDRRIMASLALQCPLCRSCAIALVREHRPLIGADMNKRLCIVHISGVAAILLIRSDCISTLTCSFMSIPEFPFPLGPEAGLRVGSNLLRCPVVERLQALSDRPVPIFPEGTCQKAQTGLSGKAVLEWFLSRIEESSPEETLRATQYARYRVATGSILPFRGVSRRIPTPIKPR